MTKNIQTIIFLLVFLLMYGAFIMHMAYFGGVGITPDSASYLREADALSNGYGFNDSGMAGGKSWFSMWPIGYPALISGFSYIFKCDTYLCSKFLTIALVGLQLFILKKRYKEHSLLYTLVFLNYGIMLIHINTWSETAFIPALLIFTLILSKIARDENCGLVYYVFLSLSMISAFLIRYFGFFTIIASSFIELILILFYCHDRQSNKKVLVSRIYKLFASVVVSVSFMLGYLLINKKMNGYMTGMSRADFNENLTDLFLNFITSILEEIKNIFSFFGHFLLQNRYWALIAVPILAILLYIIFKRLYHTIRVKKIDEPSTFFVVGIIYYITFTIVRFNSTMNLFNFRFWAPASTLIMIGIISLALENKTFVKCYSSLKAKYTSSAIMLMFAVAVIFIFIDIQLYAKQSKYSETRSNIISYLASLPSNTAFLVAGWYGGEEIGNAYSRYFREDISDFYISEVANNTIEEIKEKYKDYKYIAISTFCVKNEILVHPEEYSESIVSYVKNVISDKDFNSKFVIIPNT